MENLSLVVSAPNDNSRTQTLNRHSPLPDSVSKAEKMIRLHDKKQEEFPFRLIVALMSASALIAVWATFAYYAYHSLPYLAIVINAGGGFGLCIDVLFCSFVAFIMFVITGFLMSPWAAFAPDDDDPSPYRIRDDLRLPEIRRSMTVIKRWHEDVDEYNEMCNRQGADTKEVKEIFAELKSREADVERVIERLTELLTSYPLGSVTEPDQHEQRLQRLQRRRVEARQQACTAKAEMEIEKLD